MNRDKGRTKPFEQKSWFKSTQAILTMIGATIAVITGAIALIRSASPKEDKAYENIEIVVDASAGMRAPFHGEPKRDALKRALENVLSKQTADRDKVALRQYSGECAQEGNTRLLVDFGRGNHGRIRDELAKLKLEGKAPLVAGVVKATGDFPNAADIRKRIIVIAGDGGCDQQPEKYLGDRLMNHESGKSIVLDFSFIYLGESEDEFKKLEAIAASTGGKAYVANTAERLEAVLLHTIEVEPVLSDVRTITDILDGVVNRANDANTAIAREDYGAAQEHLKRAHDEFDRTEAILHDFRKRQNRDLFREAQELTSQNRERQREALSLLQRMIDQAKAKDTEGLRKSGPEYKAIADSYNTGAEKLTQIARKIAGGK
jgi:Mg-chelatase subunit ChlD